MDVRIRFGELLAASGRTTYSVARDSGGRISLGTAYRLKRRKGKLDTYSSALLEALCDVFGVSPGELMERDQKKRGK